MTRTSYSPWFQVGLLVAAAMFSLWMGRCAAEDADSAKKHTDDRWPAEKAWKWYADIGPVVGCNYLPRTAVNSTEMWQKDTFDPKTINEELGWAEKAGYNGIRVFLQFLVWKNDPEAFMQRLDEFLAIAAKHQIGVMLVPFCDCAFDAGRPPYLGKQDDPIPGVHNGRWAPSPGHYRVVDRAAWPDLEKYVKDVVGRFGNDRRVVIWDLYNEPGNGGMGEKSLPLVEAAFDWVRQAKPSQPLTVGVWADFRSPMSVRFMELSDVVSFHAYGAPANVQAKIAICEQYHRPMLCTEWLNRSSGNTFPSILPIFAEHGVGGYHWGLVAGRTQTYMPWGSKKGDPMPALWHHDVFHTDGKPFDPAETEQIRKFRREFQLPKTNYRGWKSAVLRNGLVEVTVAPDIGGRVIQYRLGDYEFFWVNPQLAGKNPPPGGLGQDGAWLNYGGDKLWPAPQGWDNDRQWPGPPDAVLDGSPHRCETVQDAAGKKLIRLTSGKDPRSGIQFSRDISLDERSTRVHVEATMTNIDVRPRRWGIWTVTQQNAVGHDNAGYDKNIRVYCPVNPASKLPKGYRVIFGDADNPSYHLDARRGLMCVHYQRRVGKIGLDSSAGWVATVHGSTGHAFVQRFQFDADKEYPDGASVEVWLNGAGRFIAWGKVNELKDDPVATPALIETELLSPFASLEPGEHYTFAYDWCSASVGGDYPVLDCNERGVVCAPLEAKMADGRLTLSGRFGVFYDAFLQIAFLDAQGKPLDSPAHTSRNVSPLAPVVFMPDDPLPPPPSDAATVSLRLFDADDRLFGELTRAEIKREQPCD